MMDEWEYRRALDDKLDSENRMRQHQVEMMRAQIELMKWKANLDRESTYQPPRTFEQKVDYVIELLEKYGPKLATLADVLGAMHLDEKDGG